MKQLTLAHLACVVLGFSLVLSGCGSSNNAASGSTAGQVSSTAGNDLNLTVDSVTIASPPVIEFSVTNENGTGILLDDSNAGSLRVALAKLVPGSNGDADSWQSYINRIETATPTVGPGGTPALPTAVQATTERMSAGTLESLGNGNYRYTMLVDVTNPAQTEGVTYDASLTHRLAMQVQLAGQNGNIIKNPAFDFVPNGGAVTLTKEVVKIESCNSCHDKLAIHGGGRIDTQYCVTCHNPGTVDANSGLNLDFAPMIHHIHAGTQDYTIWGFRDSAHDYSTVGYPQDLNNCTKCHDGSDTATPDADNWKQRPTKEACGTCHEDVDDINVLVAALTEMQVNFKNHPTDGFSQDDNSNCAGCHANDNVLVEAITVENVHAQTAQQLAQQFQFNILGVSYDSTSRNVTVNFSVTNPADNSNYNLASDGDAAFTAGAGASRMAILIGWDSADYDNTGSTSVPGQPISLNPLFGGATNNNDGTFTMTATLPAEASGTGVVGIEGHPALNGLRIPVANVVEYFPITDAAAVPRRQVVSIDKCNDCHDNLSLHGNNRQGTVDICVICHNANATDIDVRPATFDVLPAPDGDGVFDDFSATGVDGKREESIHFKTMIHAIHAGDADDHGFRENGIVVYGFRSSIHDYSHVRYPGTLSNCNACHVDDSYNLPTPTGTLATTVETGDGSLTGAAAEAALADRADDLNISADAATCYSCHDTAIAQEHMEIVGNASFGLTEAVIDGASGEICQACHGPGEFLAVDEVHSLSSSQ